MATQITIEKLNFKRKAPSQKVKIILLGLTPGAQQHKAISDSQNPREGAFKGYMRKQMFEWFTVLGIVKQLRLENEDSLFLEKRFFETVYMTSLLREPVYVGEKKKNYTGRSPFPWKHPELLELMNDTLKMFEKIKSPCLIIPMGKVVSQAIRDYSNLDERHFILHGFPHPSGANGSRGVQFEENKGQMKRVLKGFFIGNSI